MVISSRPLVELVPVQPAAMAGRQLCQWDKDSCADAGFLKIDLLGLGMLSAVEDCVDQIAEAYGEPIDLSRIPLDDADVYAEIQRADTVGDFQIESRAQMQSLLRTKPENLDDLTVQVALVRPGPIQGKAVHPYIHAREQLRVDPDYVPPVDHELLREPLRETHGVVVFQDQVLEVAMALAGFTVGEAEGLRRAMSRKRSVEALEAFRAQFVAGAEAKGVDAATADLVYDKLTGFSGFGFPKSHAAAFGLLAYQSAWLRHHYPAEFLCSLLNAQPMGFYPPASLVRDAQRRGVEVRSPDINLSAAGCSLEEGAVVRIGLAYVKSVGDDDADASRRRARGERAVRGRRRPRRARATLDARELEALVRSGACDRWGKRRDLLWQLGLVLRPQTVRENVQLRLSLEPTAATPALPDLTEWERMLADYAGTSLSVDVHPLTLLRPHLPPEVLASPELNAAPHRSRVAFAGLAIARQRPATANGIVFMLLEDEAGQVNLIVSPEVYERHRATVRGEPLLLVRGRFERLGENRNIVVSELESLGPLARGIAQRDVGAAALPPAPSLRPPLASEIGLGAGRSVRSLALGERRRLARRGRRELADVGERALEPHRRVDEADVRERLREVADEPAELRVVLLGEQAELVPEREQALEHLPRLVELAEEDEVVDEPEGAEEERALARAAGRRRSAPPDRAGSAARNRRREAPVAPPRACRGREDPPAGESRRAGS